MRVDRAVLFTFESCFCEIGKINYIGQAKQGLITYEYEYSLPVGRSYLALGEGVELIK
jgi:hypothetical protein